LIVFPSIGHYYYVSDYRASSEGVNQPQTITNALDRKTALLIESTETDANFAG
jgi:hypothetical protein